MAWHTFRHTIRCKIISIVIVCLFTFNNISWANPDLLKNDNSCLQVPSNINHILDPMVFHQMIIKFNAMEIARAVEKVDDFKLKITIPSSDGLFAVLDYENKKYKENDKTWHIPCSVLDKDGTPIFDYYVILDDETKAVSLRKLTKIEVIERFYQYKKDIHEIPWMDNAEEADRDGRKTEAGMYGPSDIETLRDVAEVFLEGHPNMKVRDLGGGTGKAAAVFSLYSRHVIADEIDPRYVERGRKCLDELGRKGAIDRGRIDFRHSDYFKDEVDFSEDDLIYSFWPAYDSKDKERFRQLEKKLASQMKPGAIFVLYDLGNEITSPDFEEITDSGLILTPFLKAYRKKPVRVELLKEHVKKQTGSEEIVRIEFPDESEKYYLAFRRILTALEEGKIVSLDLRSFENDDTDKSYKELKNLFGSIGGDIGSKLVGKREGLIEFSIFEILKNAFYHGNKLDFSLPIFIHMDFDDQGEPKSLQLYDAASGRMIPDEERKKAEGILHGRGQGVKLTRKEWTYSRGEITHTERGVIGTHATLFCDKEPLSLSSKKPSGDIQEKMSYGWISKRTGISVRTRGFDEREVDGFKVNAGFIFSDPLITERIRSSGVFSGYDLRDLKEVVLYNAFDESYRELNGRVKVVPEKNALWVPVKDPRNAYTDIAKALWQIVRPTRLKREIEEWDTEGKALLEAHDPEMIERIERCVTWDWGNMDPDYLFAGRSMWLKLKEPIKIGDVVFRYVKLKGTTYRGMFPPSSEEFVSGPMVSWIPDEEGRIKTITSKNILGAMSRNAAKNEFDVMKTAFEDDVSRARRIAYGIYPDIGLDDDTGSFMIMLVPEIPEATLEQLVFDHLTEIREAAARLEGSTGSVDEDLSEVMEGIKRFTIDHGMQVRQGNDKGYFFKWPHHNNCLLFNGGQGPEQRMKDFESAKIINRTMNPNKMIACRFIDVFQAIQHYKDFFNRYPALKMLMERFGFDPIRLFLDGYFSDREEDPRIKILYKALSAEDPYRPPMDEPVADAEHPVIDLIKDVEYGIPHQVPDVIGDMHVVWSGEHKKKGLRVACAQIDMGPFGEDTERMAEIVRSLKALGDNTPDLVIFPEEIREVKDTPGREQIGVGMAKEGGLEERTEALEKVARETGIAIGFCVSLSLGETYYTVVQPEGDKVTRKRFTKMHYDREKRIFTIKTSDGEYKIAVLICVECSRMMGLKDDPQVKLPADDLADEIRDADLLIVPSAMGTKTTNWVVERLFEKFNNTPTVVLNLLAHSANKPIDEARGGGNSVFVSRKTGKTALPFEEGFFEGIIMADVSRSDALPEALGKPKNTLFTRDLRPEVYRQAIEELMNITKGKSELIPGALRILERVFLNPENVDAAVFSEKLNNIATTLLLHLNSVLDEEGVRLSLRRPGKTFVNILYKAELPPYLRPTLMSIFNRFLLANTGFARQAVECIKTALQEDTSNHKFNETALELLKRLARIRPNFTFSVCAVLVDMLKRKDLDPRTYGAVADCLMEIDPAMSYLAEKYTTENLRAFILDFLETAELYEPHIKDHATPHKDVARTIVEPLAFTRPEVFGEDMLLNMAGHYPEKELPYIAFYVTARIGRVSGNERLSELLRKSDVLAGNAPDVHEKVRGILGSGRKRVLIYQGIKDGLGDELVRVSTVAQALLDYNPELEIVLYTARPHLYDNERVILKDVRNGLEKGDEEFDMVVDFSDPRENYLDLDPLDKMSYKVQSYSIKDKVKTRIYCRQEKIYHWRYMAARVDDIQVNVREGRRNVYDPSYRLCARLGLPFKVGTEGPRSLFLGVEDEGCNQWWADNVTAKNIEKRRVAVLNGFGGENETKGFTDKRDYAGAVKDLIDQGYFVVIPPNGRMARDGTPYGTEADARKVLEMLDERDQRFASITPEPQEMPKLFKHVVSKSDFIVTVEGGMMHLAYNLGKPVLVLQMPGSGDFSLWLSYALGRGQEALTQYGEFADRVQQRDESAKKDQSGLIGKWQVTSGIRFMPDSPGSNAGVLIFEAIDIAHPKRHPIEIQLRAERAPPELFDDFGRFGPDHKEVDEALEAYHMNFEGETFIIEPNDYGIEGIGTSKLRAVLRPLEKYPLAKFHELAHAFISNELSEKGESALFNYIINKLVYEGLSGEQALDKYLEKKAVKYNIGKGAKDGEERRRINSEWKKAWRVHYALRLFQKRYAEEEDEDLEGEIKKHAPHGIYPPHFPPTHIEFKDPLSGDLHGELPLEMKILDVQRNGPLIEPKEGSNEFHLNAGPLALNYMRLLFNRVVIGRPDQKGLRFSKIGLYLHDKNEGKVIKIDENMLMPESRMFVGHEAARDSDIVAYEDPRVVHRRDEFEELGVEKKQGYIYMFLTVVRRDGKYYSAVTRHKEEEFLENVYKKLDDENAEVKWEWSVPKRLITEGPLADQNIKNFVPFGNPANGKWYATFRPSQDHNSQIWLAETDRKNGLMGPWKVVGQFPYITAALPGFQHLGPSAFVAELKLENLPPALTGFDLMLIHAAALETGKYYDIRLLLTDRKNPAMKYWSEAFLAPKEGEAYELNDDKRKLWVPGVIYSCGAILNAEPEYDSRNKRFILNFDVYYSGSDTAVLWATVKIAIKYKGDEDKREALARETKRISNRLPRVVVPKEKGPVEVKAETKAEVEVKVEAEFRAAGKAKRAGLLKKHATKKTGAGKVTQVNLSSSTNSEVIEAVLRGEMVELNLKDLKSIRDKKKRFITAYSRFHELSMQLYRRFGSDPNNEIFAAIAEALRNAFVHGNKLDFDQPIYLFLGLGSDGKANKLEVFDAALHHDKNLSAVVDRDTRRKAREAKLYGESLGVKDISDDWQYTQREVTHPDHGVIGGRTTVSSLDSFDAESFQRTRESILGFTDKKFPLRNINNPRELANNLVEMVVSGTLANKGRSPEPKKFVLAFDKNIKNAEAVNIFRELEDLKKDPKYKKILRNLEIIIPSKSQDLSDAVGGYLGRKDSVVFIFSEFIKGNEKDELAWARKAENVRLSYIQRGKDFHNYHYYPLAEVVTITLARYITDGRISGFTKDELGAVNIEEIKPESEEKTSALIFTILPNIERIDHNLQIDRYAALRSFIEAA